MTEPNLELLIEPDELVFSGLKAGTVHSAKLTLKNIGNIPVTVPERVTPNVQEPDFLANRLLNVIRRETDEDPMAVLGAFVKDLRTFVSTQETLTLKGGGKLLKPDSSISLTLDITVPKTRQPLHYIEGDCNILSESVFYIIGP